MKERWKMIVINCIFIYFWICTKQWTRHQAADLKGSTIHLSTEKKSRPFPNYEFSIRFSHRHFFLSYFLTGPRCTCACALFILIRFGSLIITVFFFFSYRYFPNHLVLLLWLHTAYAPVFKDKKKSRFSPATAATL